jgi:hypothetical protein
MNNEKVHEEIDAFKKQMGDMITMIRNIPGDFYKIDKIKADDDDDEQKEQLRVLNYIKCCKEYIYCSMIKRIGNEKDIIYMRYLENEINNLNPDDSHITSLKKENTDIWGKIKVHF